MHPVPIPLLVVAVAVYVPSVYPDPVPVTLNETTSPNALTPVELLLLTTFCLILNFPASKLPKNVAVPDPESIDTTSDVPSVILKSTLVPPLNVKSPSPLVSKLRGTLISVPSPAIVFVASIVSLAVVGPNSNLLVVVLTLKNGLALVISASSFNPVKNKPSVPTVPFSVPPTANPITSAADLNRPVVDELSNDILGVAAAPSVTFRLVFAIELVPPDIWTPALAVNTPETPRV